MDPHTIESTSSAAPERWATFPKRSMLDGYPATLRCVDVLGQTFVIHRGLATTISLEEEWYEDLREPERVTQLLLDSSRPPADLFTFWQRYPNVEAKLPYLVEWEEIAVLDLSSVEHWRSKQVKPQVRNKIRKSEKAGVVVREVDFDEAFVRGMVKIFNESPTRQGRPFWHYGKSIDTVREQFSRCVHRERMIAAYYGTEIIGFVMLANAGPFAIPGQIIASLDHRDKGTTNALMAKTVELCVQMGLRSLVYMYWSDDSLADFKRSCGFEPVRVPRYWVPLTPRGRAILGLGLHRGVRAAIPPALKTRLKEWRRKWYERGVS